MKLLNISHDTIKLEKLGLHHMSCKNVNSKKKEYETCKSDPLTDLKYMYSQLAYMSHPKLIVTTPIMVCPFGINKQGTNFKMCLQFTNYSSDNSMNSFHEFIQECEFNQMKHLGLTEDTSDLFLSQNRYDKRGKYDPNLEVKIPFSYNKFQCDIFSDDYEGVGIMNISKFCKVQCDIYLDKIWKYNDNYVSKWKVKMIHLL